MVSDIKALQCLTISQLFEEKAEKVAEPEGEVSLFSKYREFSLSDDQHSQTIQIIFTACSYGG